MSFPKESPNEVHRISVVSSLFELYMKLIRANTVHRFGDIKIIFQGPKCTVRVGNYSYGRIDIHSYQNNCNVRIGHFVSISDLTIITGGNHHRGISTYPFKARLLHDNVENDNEPPKQVKIGNDVWIGNRVTILDGSEIGTGSIIGANSVVAGYIPPYSIALGNPAKVIKKRFNEDEIKGLLDSQWWNIDVEYLLQIIDLIYTNNVAEFIRRIENFGHNQPSTEVL